MADVLFGHANFELATEYLSTWFKMGIDVAESMGYRVVDLPGDAFTLNNLLDALENYSFSAIFLGGHGNDTTLTGQNYAEILKACQNDQVMSGNMTYFCSCFTGAELGPSMISKNTQAYVGYTRDFRFMVNTDLSPMEDSLTSLAQPFQEILLEIIIRILRGEGLAPIYNGGIAKGNEWVERLFDRPEYVWSQVISFIQHDTAALISLGEREGYGIPSVSASLIPVAASAGIGAALTILSIL